MQFSFFFIIRCFSSVFSVYRIEPCVTHQYIVLIVIHQFIQENLLKRCPHFDECTAPEWKWMKWLISGIEWSFRVYCRLISNKNCDHQSISVFFAIKPFLSLKCIAIKTNLLHRGAWIDMAATTYSTRSNHPLIASFSRFVSCFLVNLCYRTEWIIRVFTYISVATNEKWETRGNIYEVIIIILKTNQLEMRWTGRSGIRLIMLFYLAFMINRFVNGVKLWRFLVLVVHASMYVIGLLTPPDLFDYFWQWPLINEGMRVNGQWSHIRCDNDA